MGLFENGEPIFVHEPVKVDSRNAKGHQGSSSFLTASISEGMKVAGWKADDLELIALPLGPGSFTGLRVGVVTAKTLAYVHDIPVVGLNTLQVVAAQTTAHCEASNLPKPERVTSVVNAQRRQLFSAEFTVGDENQVTMTEEASIVDREAWIDSLVSGWVTGTGLAPIETKLREQKPGLKIAPEEIRRVLPKTLNDLAVKEFKAGKQDDLWTLAPQYFRPSSAEEKANSKQAKSSS